MPILADVEVGKGVTLGLIVLLKSQPVNDFMVLPQVVMPGLHGDIIG